MGCGVMDWIELAQNMERWRVLLNAVVNQDKIFRKWDVGLWTGSSWLRIWTGGGYF